MYKQCTNNSRCIMKRYFTSTYAWRAPCFKRGFYKMISMLCLNTILCLHSTYNIMLRETLQWVRCIFSLHYVFTKAIIYRQTRLVPSMGIDELVKNSFICGLSLGHAPSKLCPISRRTHRTARKNVVSLLVPKMFIMTPTCVSLS